MHRFGDICRPFIVSADMGSDPCRVDVYFGLLSRSFKVEQDSSVGLGILYVEQCFIPPGALVVIHVRVYGICGIEAMGQGDRRP